MTMIKNPMRALLRVGSSNSNSNSNNSNGAHTSTSNHNYSSGSRNPSMDTNCGDLAVTRKSSRVRQGGPIQLNPSPLAMKSFDAGSLASGNNSASSSPKILRKEEENDERRMSTSKKPLLKKQSSSMFDFSTAGTTLETSPEGAANGQSTSSNAVQGPSSNDNSVRPRLAKQTSVLASTSSGVAKPPRPLVVQRGDSSYNVVVNCRRDVDTVCLQNSAVRDFVRLNVGGHVFLTKKKNFASFPLSRLGRLMRARDESRILDLCDAYDPGHDDKTLGTSRTIPTFFFDHNGKDFDQILDLYRRGSLHICGEGSTRCAATAHKDLEYWGIDEYIFESCCGIKYHQGKEDCNREMAAAGREERLAEEAADEDSFGSTRLERIRRAAWNLLEYPDSSKAAKIFAVVSFCVILLSTLTFLLGVFVDDDSADVASNTFADVLVIIDNAALAFFTVEYLTRLASAPSFWKFLVSLESLPDLLAILPFLLSILVYELQAFNIVGKASKLLHLIRIVKVFRVFKLIRYLASLQSLLVTLKQANREMRLLALVASIALLMASTLTYYAEKKADGADYNGNNNNSSSSNDKFAFTDSLWYSLMTLTTVGFSERQPESMMGRVCGCLSAVFGAFLMTLPIPVVINSFAGYYRNTLIRRVVLTKRARRLGERRRALRFQAIGVFLEEDNAVAALAKAQLGGIAGDSSMHGESI